MSRLTLTVFALGIVGCHEASDMRQWRPEDHDQPNRPQGQVTAATSNPERDAAALSKLAWQKHCQSCHGIAGLGDGPQGPMVNAPNLAEADRIAKLTDAQLAETIRNGKNRMPGTNLPDGVIQGLILRIREGKFGK